MRNTNSPALFPFYVTFSGRRSCAIIMAESIEDAHLRKRSNLDKAHEEWPDFVGPNEPIFEELTYQKMD